MAGSDFLGVSRSLHVFTSTNALEGAEESFGGVNVEGINDEGELGDVHDSVTSGEDKRSDS